jgi:excisionase family DNA binding protein
MLQEGVRKYLSKKELAEFLGLSVYTIDAWVSQRRAIPFIKMGRRVMFDLQDVLDWVEAQKNHPVAP